MKKEFCIIVIFLTLNSCISLNGTYCTPPDFVGTCYTFDKKSHTMLVETAGCTGGEVKKGKYRRLGNLIRLDLIPYPKRPHPHNFYYVEDKDIDSIDFNLTLRDWANELMSMEAVSILDSLGHYIITQFTNDEGKVHFRVAKKDKPYQIYSYLWGENKGKISAINIEKLQSFEMEAQILSNFIVESDRNGIEYFRVKKVKKDSLIFQVVGMNKDFWGWAIDTNWHKVRRFYSKIIDKRIKKDIL
jgi:hypothetical protein